MNAPNTNPVVPRERILSDARDIIESLPRIGALMITAKQAGVTHERIGAIESVTMGRRVARLHRRCRHLIESQCRLHRPIPQASGPKLPPTISAACPSTAP
jgi:hypothetical protein